MADYTKRARFDCWTWDNGRKTAEHTVVGSAAGVQIQMGDGRTAQMFFHADGTLQVRAWGNVAILLGNGDVTSFRAVVAPEEPTCDEHGNRLTDGGSDA